MSQRFKHPNLRQTFDFGVIDDGPYLVLEYVEGPTLFELIKRHKKLPVDLCIFIAKELAQAILAIHQKKVLHLDIKSGNIFVSYSGEIKLGDLGLAKERNDVAPWASGTPAYMSPEQVMGKEATEASDLFSFGAVLYEMLTGVVAFASSTLSATLLHVANWDPIPISRLRPEAPAELVLICHKLLVKEPAERFHTAQEVIESLVQVERVYDLKITRQNLTEFIESPGSYRDNGWQPLTTPSFHQTESKRRAPKNHWGITAVVSAIMFLLGVLFIKGVKLYTERQTSVHKQGQAAASPNHERPLTDDAGFLFLNARPGTMIFIDGDSAGTTPLFAPIELAPGEHEVSLRHAQTGDRTLNVSIETGDTLRQTIDFNKP